MRAKPLLLLMAIGLVAGACSDGDAGDAITVTSAAFAGGGRIPARYSCEDENISPPLAWRGVPKDAAELAVVVSDPDAPRGTFFHWIVVGVRASERAFGEGAVPEGAVQVKGSSQNPTYIGMCPPNGEEHTYDFTVHALDRSVVGDIASKPAAAAAALIDSHTIAEGSLTGRFGR